MNWLENPIRISDPKNWKKNQSGIVACEQKTTSEKANFCSNTVFSLYSKIRAKNHAAEPLAFSIHFLFQNTTQGIEWTTYNYFNWSADQLHSSSQNKISKNEKQKWNKLNNNINIEKTLDAFTLKVNFDPNKYTYYPKLMPWGALLANKIAEIEKYDIIKIAKLRYFQIFQY